MANTRDVANLTTEQVEILNKAVFDKWDEETTKMKKDAENAKKIDASNVKPEDISVRFGPVMDEKTFKEYQRRKDGRMNVISADQLMKMMGKK